MLGFDVVGEKPEYPAVFLSDGNIMVTLWQAAAAAAPFDRRHNVGLHHLAFRLRDLKAVHDTLKALREGTAPGELANVAGPELMGQVTRAADYKGWTDEFLR